MNYSKSFANYELLLFNFINLLYTYMQVQVLFNNCNQIDTLRFDGKCKSLSYDILKISYFGDIMSIGKHHTYNHV